MTNVNEEMIEEYDDMDADIQKKQALIEEIKALSEGETDSETIRTVRNLKKQYSRIKYWESGYEDELRDTFESYADAIFSRMGEVYKSAKANKEALIARAKELAETDNLNAATAEMNDMMEDWKAAGSAGREVDDQLWEEFQAARQVFYDRKHQAWEDQRARFETARQKKEELIEEAAKLADSKDWNKTSNAMRDLMNQWKAAGSAGRKHDDELWNRFNEARQVFYDNRAVHYKEVSAEQNERYDAKKALVARAQAILDEGVFGRSQTDQMKNLSSEWKKVGYCGKERDDKVWAEFRAVMDQYFDALKKNNEQRHQDWVDRMMDARARKQELINKQRRQIERLEEDMNGLVSQAEMENIQYTIEDKARFVAELEEEIADIDEKING